MAVSQRAAPLRLPSYPALPYFLAGSQSPDLLTRTGQAMKIAKVKNGIVGLGMVCDSHIKAYQSDPRAEVIAVCDLDGARAKAVADEFGIKSTYTSYEEMLKNEDINTVDIT